MSKRAEAALVGSCQQQISMLLAALFSAFLLFTPGGAEACSKHPASGNFTRLVSITHNGRHSAHATAAAAVLKQLKAGSETSGGVPGSAGGCHCCGGCVNGCCAGCFAAIDVGDSSFVLDAAAAAYVLPTQGGFISFRPQPDFRPPRFV
jgi:hypothetical protein